MDALILSCGTGGGHNAACSAIENELASRGHNVKSLNPYLLRGKRTAAAINGAYNILAQRAPTAFGMIYKLGNAYRKLPVSSPVYHANKLMRPYLEQYLEENHFDAVVMTHLFPAEILTNMKRRGKTVPKNYFIATDYTCIPFTEEIDCDRYIIPAKELTGDFIRRGIPEDSIYPLGIPTRGQFRWNFSREAAKEQLGLDRKKKYILVSGGSIGAGQIEDVVALLRKHYDPSKVKVIVVCGNNHSLYLKLLTKYRSVYTILEHTSKMAEYMKACDLFISKPGGLSSTEAAVIGTALIHITPIPGCETFNMRFFERNGMCVAVKSPKRQLIDACERMMDETARAQMCANQRRIIRPDATSTICDLIESDFAAG